MVDWPLQAAAEAEASAEQERQAAKEKDALHDVPIGPPREIDKLM